MLFLLQFKKKFLHTSKQSKRSFNLFFFLLGCINLETFSDNRFAEREREREVYCSLEMRKSMSALQRDASVLLNFENEQIQNTKLLSALRKIVMRRFFSCNLSRKLM